MSEVGIPEKNGTAFSNQTVTIKRNYGSCHFLFLFRIPYIRCKTTGLSKWNSKVWSKYSVWNGILGTTSRDGTPETDLSVFWCLTQINRIFGIIESNLYFPQMINSLIFIWHLSNRENSGSNHKRKLLTSGYKLNLLRVLIVSGYSVTLQFIMAWTPSTNVGASTIVL